MTLLDDILSRRRNDERYDEELWSLMDKMNGPRLSHLTDEVLQTRLDALDRNIQYLDVGNPCRDDRTPDRGWLSPWWWLRARYWTMAEFDRRGVVPGPTSVLPPMPALHSRCQGVVAGGNRILVRFSRRDWMLDALRSGAVRLTPAELYRNLAGDSARADEELRKSFHRASSFVTITKQDGTPIEAIGEVTFSTVRAVERETDLVEGNAPAAFQDG